ncbi:transposase [Marinobacterium mangrovicola]|uniref:transposase n=1 Tax=Marinobacterium mangrovicola TaxID=1476959 RepID=UPI003C781ECB
MKIVKGHLMPDHIHMCISIRPKCSYPMWLVRLRGNSATPSLDSSEVVRDT